MILAWTSSFKYSSSLESNNFRFKWMRSTNLQLSRLLLQRGDRHLSDVDPRAVRVEIFLMVVDP